MNPWAAKGLALAGSIAMVVIRAPFAHRALRVPVATSAQGAVDRVLVVVAWLGFMTPFVWVATPLLGFADFPLQPWRLLAGATGIALGLLLFRRAHADLGTNWSITLEIRQGHRLVTGGVYRHVRHPMYSSLLLYGIGQWLALPNHVAGPSYFVPILLLTAHRITSEERMMRERFGEQYAAYAGTTKRLLPGVW
jgi:protein-S-isoprenylcysteine O-methyltransferase Ste14